jgi:hypothetical protein
MQISQNRNDCHIDADFEIVNFVKIILSDVKENRITKTTK